MPSLPVPVLLKDREVDDSGFEAFEIRTLTLDTLLPGPVSDRVAIVDLRDAPTGPFTLRPADPLPATAAHLVPRTLQPHLEPSVRRWSAFATVLETLRLFEADDCLGRTIPWAFAGEQLLVVPEAGEDANAFYDRGSRSLQLFWFDVAGSVGASDSGTEGGHSGQASPSPVRIHTAASQDIVTHETAHAVLDGIAPWLYDASGPESLALHESVADLTALFAAALSAPLADRALEMTSGDLTRTPLFAALAPEFGRGVYGREAPLRSLVDVDPLAPLSLAAFSPAPAGGGLEPEPHDLSVVLSRAFYALVLDVYDARLENPPPRPTSRAFALRLPADPLPAADQTLASQRRALRFAVNLVKRLLFRGLDYLPPADAGFLDLARAVLACDRAGHPEDTTGVRGLFIQRLLERGIGQAASALDTPHDAVAEALGSQNLTMLAGSTWSVMQLVEKHRAVLGIPLGTPFEVLPRLRVRKVLIRPTERPVREELLIKIAWRLKEPSAASGGLPGARWVRHGSTVVFDAETSRVCAFVNADPAVQIEARDRWVGALGPGLPAHSTDCRGAHWVDAEGAYELRGTLGLLHCPHCAPAQPRGGQPGAQPDANRGNRGRTVEGLPSAPQGVDATAFRELWGRLSRR